jgi:DNA-binding NtrC family response regulator
MALKDEHSLAASPASNRIARGVPAVLRAVLEATGWERAFLARPPRPGDRGAARIEASASTRGGDRRIPSRTVLRRAFEMSGILFCPDARRDPSLAAGASVRSLDIRSVVSVPVPARGAPGALVLDRRIPEERVSEGLLRVLEAFAGVLAAMAGPQDRSPRNPERAAASLVGRSPVFLETLAWARRVAGSRLPVLLTGETGTGKEEIARAIHRDSPRAAGPFLAVNCAALPETLLESEMFGATRGAYTGAERDRPGLFRLAHGGTLLLDEIGDMPLAVQAKLLRVLQDGRVRPVGGPEEIAVDVRILAATHRDLSAQVAAGAFRPDLYWRLAVAEVRVPPLRERRQDVLILTEHFLPRLGDETGAGREMRLDRSAMQALEACDWPGNVRQLQAVLARALLRCESGIVSAGHLDLPPPAARGESGACSLTPLERGWIEGALHESGGSVARTAARVGWTRQKLYRRMNALGLPARPAG